MQPIRTLTIATVTPDFGKEVPEKSKFTEVIFNIDCSKSISRKLPKYTYGSSEYTGATYRIFQEVINSNNNFSELHIQKGFSDGSFYDLLSSFPHLKKLTLDNFNLDLLLKNGTLGYYPTIIDDYNSDLDVENYSLKRAQGYARDLSKALSQNNVKLTQLVLTNCSDVTQDLVHELIKKIPSLTLFSCEGCSDLVISPKQLKEFVKGSTGCGLRSFILPNRQSLDLA